MPFVVVSAAWKVAAGVWEESVMLPSPLAWVWGANAWARDGDMSSWVIFLVRLVFVADVTAELFISRVHLGIVLKAEMKAIMNNSIAPSARLPEFYR